MVHAIQERATDGVGLGRPITAEPSDFNIVTYYHSSLDFPKKILASEVQSAIYNPFDDDFAVSNASSNSQMAQAGSTSLQDIGGDLRHGIMDLSDERVAEDYKEGITKYFDHITKVAQAGEPVAGVFEYGNEVAVSGS